VIWGEGGGGKRVTCVRTVFHHANSHNADLECIAGLSGDEVDGDLWDGEEGWGVFTLSHG